MDKIGAYTPTANGAGQFDESIPTNFRAAFANAFMNELLYVITQGDLVPSAATETQVWDAIAAKFLGKDSNQTFTGSYFQVSHSNPSYVMNETDAPADEKRWTFQTVGGEFSLRAVNDAWSVTNKVFAVTRTGATPVSITTTLPVSVGALQVGGIGVVDSSRQYLVELIRANSRTRMPAAAFDGSQKHALRYGADDTDVLQTIVRIAANNYLFTNRGPFSIQDSSGTETVRIGSAGKMTNGVVPYDRTKKLTANGSNASTFNIATVTTLVTVSLGTVEVGDVIDVQAVLGATKDGTAGNIIMSIEKNAGTAAIEFVGTNTSLGARRYAPAGDIIGESICGQARVTTAGTLTLGFTSSGGGTSNISGAVGAAKLDATVLQGA